MICDNYDFSKLSESHRRLLFPDILILILCEIVIWIIDSFVNNLARRNQYTGITDLHVRKITPSRILYDVKHPTPSDKLNRYIDSVCLEIP